MGTQTATYTRKYGGSKPRDKTEVVIKTKSQWQADRAKDRKRQKNYEREQRREASLRRRREYQNWLKEYRKEWDRELKRITGIGDQIDRNLAFMRKQTMKAFPTRRSDFNLDRVKRARYFEDVKKKRAEVLAPYVRQQKEYGTALRKFLATKK